MSIDILRNICYIITTEREIADLSRKSRAGETHSLSRQDTNRTHAPGPENKEGEANMSENDIIRKVKLLREMQRMAEDAQAEAEALKDEIKAYIGDSEELRAGEYKITWKPVESTRVDTAALRREMPSIAEAFTTKTTTRRFCVA